MNTADRNIAALRTNHDELVARVEGMSADDLRRTSGSSEWTVAQVLSHLGSGAEIMLASVAAGSTGTGTAPGNDFNQSVWDRWNALSPEEQAAGFLRSDQELITALESLDADARGDFEVDLGFLPQPADLATLSAMRLSEVALHSWDVRIAQDSRAVLGEDEAGLMLDNYLHGPLSWMVGFLGKARDADPGETALRVQTTDPARTVGLVVGPSIKLADGAPDAEGVLTIPAEAFLRLLTGRLRPEHTPASVELTGSAMTLDGLRAVFPGY